MSRDQSLTDEQWARIEPLFPTTKGRRSRPFRDHRQVFEGISFRYRTGCPWRDLPASFGPWSTVWRRHYRMSADGTWDKILTQLLSEADAAGELDWVVSVDSTTARVHQHAASLPREVVEELPSHTGGTIELQESALRAC